MSCAYYVSQIVAGSDEELTFHEFQGDTSVVSEFQEFSDMVDMVFWNLAKHYYVDLVD